MGIAGFRGKSGRSPGADVLGISLMFDVGLAAVP